MTRLACSLSLLCALAVMPRAAAASPSTLASLQTVAVATEPGVAEVAVASTGTTTTQVSVMVSTEATTPAPAFEAAPASEPTPPPASIDQAALEQRYRYADQIHDDRKSGRGLIAGGLTIAGAAYLFTSLAGAVAIDRSRDFTDDPVTEGDESRRGDRRRAYGQALMMPGIGPALAIVRADTAVRAWAAGVAGLAQGVGVGLTLVGIHRLSRARRLERLQLSAMGTSRQAHVALSVRF